MLLLSYSLCCSSHILSDALHLFTTTIKLSFCSSSLILLKLLAYHVAVLPLSPTALLFLLILCISTFPNIFNVAVVPQLIRVFFGTCPLLYLFSCSWCCSLPDIVSSIPPYPFLLSVSSHLTRVPTTHQRAGHCIVAIQHQCPLQLLSLHTRHISRLRVVSVLDHTRILNDIPTLPGDLPGGVGPAGR